MCVTREGQYIRSALAPVYSGPLMERHVSILLLIPPTVTKYACLQLQGTVKSMCASSLKLAIKSALISQKVSFGMKLQHNLCFLTEACILTFVRGKRVEREAGGRRGGPEEAPVSSRPKQVTSTKPHPPTAPRPPGPPTPQPEAARPLCPHPGRGVRGGGGCSSACASFFTKVLVFFVSSVALLNHNLCCANTGSCQPMDPQHVFSQSSCQAVYIYIHLLPGVCAIIFVFAAYVYTLVCIYIYRLAKTTTVDYGRPCPARRTSRNT